jgi:hypothetical protein
MKVMKINQEQNETANSKQIQEKIFELRKVGKFKQGRVVSVKCKKYLFSTQVSKVVRLITSTEVGRLSRRRGPQPYKWSWINKIRNKRGYFVRRCVFVIGLLILV